MLLLSAMHDRSKKDKRHVKYMSTYYVSYLSIPSGSKKMISINVSISSYFVTLYEKRAGAVLQRFTETLYIYI
jgi:hypothetical protein